MLQNIADKIKGCYIIRFIQALFNHTYMYCRYNGPSFMSGGGIYLHFYQQIPTTCTLCDSINQQHFVISALNAMCLPFRRA